MSSSGDIFASDVRQLQTVMSGMLRAMDFARVEAVLSDALARTPSPIADICRRQTADAISFAGWDRVFARFTKLQRADNGITAIGIDLSGHGEDVEPALELSFYSDGPFAFSTSTQEELRAACADYSPPWRGDFVDLDYDLTIAGVSELHVALADHPDRFRWPDGPIGDLPVETRACMLGQWWLILRVHQAMLREVKDVGLPQAMPMILSEHDFGPEFTSVFMVTKVADHGAATDAILAQQAASNKAQYAKVTADTVSDLREHRALALAERRGRPSPKMLPLLEMQEARDAMILSISNIKIDKPTWQMSDAEFEALLDRYQLARDPDYRPAALSSPPSAAGASPPVGRSSFGRKGGAAPMPPQATAPAPIRPAAPDREVKPFSMTNGTKIKLYFALVIGLPILFGLKGCVTSILGG